MPTNYRANLCGVTMKNTEIPSLSNVSNTEIHINTTTCPSCLMEREAKATECPSCGIVFSQYYRWSKEKRTKLTISGIYHLNVSEIEALETGWKNVEMMYWDQQVHDKFLHMCLRLKSLPFAAHAYTERLKIFNDDDIAYLQLQKIVSLSRDWFGMETPEDLGPFNKSLVRIAAALSVIGICAGVVTLFVGMLTASRGYYALTGVVMAVVFTVLFVRLKRLASQVG